MEFEEFYTYYTVAVTDNPNSNFIIHFRIRTHGVVSTLNCHPFIVNDNQVFIHNGIIAKAAICPKKEKNDTQMFNEEYLQTFPVGWEKAEGLVKLVEDFIGNSKLCVLNSDGTVTIFNADKGHWENNIWWSNYSHRCMKTFDKVTGKKKYVPSYSNNYYKNHNNSYQSPHNRAIELKKQYIIDKSNSDKVHSTIPKHYHSDLELLEEDDWLADLAELKHDFAECEVCGAMEIGYLVTTVVMHGVKERICRDCLRTIDCAGLIYYEHNIKTLTDVYEEYHAEDDGFATLDANVLEAYPLEEEHFEHYQDETYYDGMMH